MQIIRLLDICEGSVISVIGCGGKTSLIGLLAEKLHEKKVLISTTTKMYPMITGAQCLGRLNPENGKLEALPDHELMGLIPNYNVTLLEADGSRGLFCKGWLANEPVVPPYCTHTAGVVTMAAFGKPATETYIHRLPEFLALTGLKAGETITTEALETMTCSPNGMFKNSAGRKYLIINQVEDDETAGIALEFLQTIKANYPNRFERLLYGSVRLDAWQEA